MLSSIRHGCQVSELVGPLQAGLLGSKWQQRVRFFGTIIPLASNQPWVVWWDSIGHYATHASDVVKSEGDSSLTEVWFERSDVNDLLRYKNLSNQHGIDTFICNRHNGSISLGEYLLSSDSMKV
eukprot:9826166-Ditylum_brightwellii.AAC.1